jgi:Tfp pilus assembly protein PilO
MPINRKDVTTALNQFYAKPVARVSVELLLTLCTILFFALFAIRPTLLTMSDLIKEIEDKRKLDTQLSQKIASLSSAQSEYLKAEDRLVVLDEALPAKPQVIEAVKIIEKIASARNLAITSLNITEVPQEPTDAPAFEETTRQNINVAITITGDYLTIRQFIEDIKGTRRSFVIDTVVFATNQESGTTSLRATITLSLPYFGVKS